MVCPTSRPDQGRPGGRITGWSGGSPGDRGRAKEVAVATYEGYCVKCREKREFDGQVVELKNGRKAAQGTCPVCSTKMNRILGKNA